MTGPATLFARPRAVRGRCRRSSDDTLRALRDGGRLERVDEALVVAHRVAADNVDAAERLASSPFVVANAVRTYLMATAALYARVGLITPDDDDEIWRELSGPLVDPATS